MRGHPHPILRSSLSGCGSKLIQHVELFETPLLAAYQSIHLHHRIRKLCLRRPTSSVQVRSEQPDLIMAAIKVRVFFRKPSSIAEQDNDPAARLVDWLQTCEVLRTSLERQSSLRDQLLEAAKDRCVC